MYIYICICICIYIPVPFLAKKIGEGGGCYYNKFVTVLYQFLETGTSERTFMDAIKS